MTLTCERGGVRFRVPAAGLYAVRLRQLWPPPAAGSTAEQQEERGRRRAKTDLVVLEALGLDLVGDRERVVEGRDRLSDLGEGEHESLGAVATGHLLLGLLAERDDADVLAGALALLDVLAGGLADRRVDTTAEATVRRGDNVEDLLDLGLGLGSLGLLKDGLVGLAVRLGVTHRTLRTRETRSGNHLR